MRRQRLLVVALAALLTAGLVLLVYGERYASGGVVLRFSDQHGLHRSDLPILGGYVPAMVICMLLFRRPRN